MINLTKHELCLLDNMARNRANSVFDFQARTTGETVCWIDDLQDGPHALKDKAIRPLLESLDRKGMIRLGEATVALTQWGC
jgi:hypothetical protein